MHLSRGWEACLIALAIGAMVLLAVLGGPIVYKKIKEVKKQWQAMWGCHF